MGNIHHITLRVIAQATESVDRVKDALSVFVFDNEIDTVTTEGHYGNPITLLQAHLEGRDCNRFIGLLRSKLPEHELERLKNERCERIDEDCTFHIGLDKQAAFQGGVRLATTADKIAAGIKLKAYPARREKAIEAAEEILTSMIVTLLMIFLFILQPGFFPHSI